MSTPKKSVKSNNASSKKVSKTPAKKSPAKKSVITKKESKKITADLGKISKQISKQDLIQGTVGIILLIGAFAAGHYLWK